MQIKERLNLLTLLQPLKGSFAVISKKVELRKVLELSEQERVDAEVKQEVVGNEGRFTWNGEKDPNKVINLEPYREVVEKAVDAFKAAHEEKQSFTEEDILLIENALSLLNPVKTAEEPKA